MSEQTKLAETEKPGMAQSASAAAAIEIDISHIQTEDNAPVDSFFAAREQRLLVGSLQASWKPDAPFIACENVGIFYGLYLPPIVPDVFISLGISPPQGAQMHEKRRRSYFVWEYGKPPDVVVEILSPSYGGEFDEKMKIYAQIGVSYYVVHDPAGFHSEEKVNCYELRGKGYVKLSSGKLEGIGLEARLWSGKFEGSEAEWLRWYDAQERLLLTGEELAEAERARAEQERARAEQERSRADRLAAALRQFGIDPDKL